MKKMMSVFCMLTSEEKVQCAFLFVSILVGGILETAGIGGIFPLMSAIEQGDFYEEIPWVSVTSKSLGFESHVAVVILWSAVLGGLFLLKNSYLVWQTRKQINFINRLQVKYVSGLFFTYLLRPYGYHVNVNSAILLRNIDSSGRAIFYNLMMSVFSLIAEIITAGMILTALLWMDFWLTMGSSIVLGGLVFIIIKYFRKRIVQAANVEKQAQSIFIKWVNQGLGAIKETKIMGREMFFYEEFSDAYRAYGKANGEYMFWKQLPRMIIETIVVLALLCVIVIKAHWGDSLENLVPSLAVLGLATFRLMPSANRIVGYYNDVQFNQPLFFELYSDLVEIHNREESQKETAPGSSAAAMQFRHEISIQNVWFRYSGDDKEILRGISFKIHKGDFVGIIGSSGAGKTTFVDVFCGLFAPTEGEICVDGKDVFSDIRGWQMNLAYVPQDIYLIDGTIKENIALGEKEDDMDESWIENILQMADLYDFVNTLPKGMETCVGERGVNLSGGQRQRVGIARALYRRPSVLVLDEATSALDVETEKSIMNTILKLKGRLTILSIAHRLSTLTACDYKIEFDNGCAKKI